MMIRRSFLLLLSQVLVQFIKCQTGLDDLPYYSEIPTTNFRCKDQSYPGYYSDPEASCQVFHICVQRETILQQYTFLCPNETVFHQELLVCVWYDNFDCTSAPSFYSINDEIYDSDEVGRRELVRGRSFGNSRGRFRDEDDGLDGNIIEDTRAFDDNFDLPSSLGKSLNSGFPRHASSAGISSTRNQKSLGKSIKSSTIDEQNLTKPKNVASLKSNNSVRSKAKSTFKSNINNALFQNQNRAPFKSHLESHLSKPAHVKPIFNPNITSRNLFASTGSFNRNFANPGTLNLKNQISSFNKPVKNNNIRSQNTLGIHANEERGKSHQKEKEHKKSKDRNIKSLEHKSHHTKSHGHETDKFHSETKTVNSDLHSKKHLKNKAHIKSKLVKSNSQKPQKIPNSFGITDSRGKFNRITKAKTKSINSISNSANRGRNLSKSTKQNKIPSKKSKNFLKAKSFSKNNRAASRKNSVSGDDVLYRLLNDVALVRSKSLAGTSFRPSSRNKRLGTTKKENNEIKTNNFAKQLIKENVKTNSLNSAKTTNLKSQKSGQKQISLGCVFNAKTREFEGCSSQSVKLKNKTAKSISNPKTSSYSGSSYSLGSSSKSTVQKISKPQKQQPEYGINLPFNYQNKLRSKQERKNTSNKSRNNSKNSHSNHKSVKSNRSKTNRKTSRGTKKFNPRKTQESISNTRSRKLFAGKSFDKNTKPESGLY